MQTEGARKQQLDPEKLKFFIGMKEATKKKVVLKTNYDLSLSMSWQKKR
jgi:hypothetical protein